MTAERSPMTAPHLDRNAVGQGALAAGSAHHDDAERELHELLTVDDVAALLKVSRSWVYEHTRARCRAPTGCLRQNRQIRPVSVESGRGLPGQAIENRVNRSRRPLQWPASYRTKSPREERTVLSWLERNVGTGSGCLLKRGRGWAIRWREREIAPDGTTASGCCATKRWGRCRAAKRRHAGARSGRSGMAARGRRGQGSRFDTLAGEWQATVLPMYKHSTQKNHRHIVAKHLLPRFGDKPIADVTRQEVQAYVAHLTQAGYAPKTIDHIHDVLSAVLRTAVKWGHLQDNPGAGVDLPTLKTVRPKWALTVRRQAGGADRGPAAPWPGRWWGWRC